MPIGSSKLGVLGAGLVPGGTETFNASGTWDVPPGVKKVSITGKGGTGNPGIAGNPGNPGNPGTGGTGGGGGKQAGPSGNLDGSPGGGSWNAGIICNPLVNNAAFPNADNNTGFHPSNPNPNISPLYRAGGQGSRPGPGAPPQPGNAGSGGNAGSAGTAGTAGNIGQSSSALCNTFPGGAAGNAPPGGNAGNAGTAGNGGGAGNPGNPSNPGNSGSGGNGGGSGGTVNATPPSTCGLTYVYATGGGGAGITNDGQTGKAAETNGPSPFPFASGFERFALGGTYSQASAPILEPGVPFNNPRVNPACTSFFGPRSPNPGNNCYITNAPVNTVGGMGSSGGGTHAITTAVKINQSQQEPSQIPLGYLYPLGFAGPGPVNFPAPRRWLTAWNPAPLSPELFRAGAGGGGAGSILQGASPPPIFRSGGSAGGGGRGNAGNAGGPSPTVSGQAATPVTFNCVPVTPGTPTPITVGAPGGQIVISWNPQ